ncbi:MAG: glycosyltransferase N-terminal domain-containing protein [Flavobacteriaceae bacterium]|nr:glycosyltransferase N-terminal domain-containing protein [Flavobacteriaceae bacterium]
MHLLYNFSIFITSKLILLTTFFSKKMNLFVYGRKTVFDTLKESINTDDKTIWFHCASLGEYEQGVPIMEKSKELFPNYKIIVTFFSPSGFEVKKNATLANIVLYLPIDTVSNSKRFIELAHPSLAIFIKYEFWPNYLVQLKEKKIPTFLVSGLFRKDQIFFKPYGDFMRKVLNSFDHFFVQDETSKELLNNINIKKTTVSGDTRFDRVSNQLLQDNNLAFISEFKQNNLCIVCGSTWPEDEAVLIDYINKASDNVKFIIAPHEISASKIESLRKNMQKKSSLFSTKEVTNISQYNVLIIDTVGLLTKIYSHADIAYVGGGKGDNGLHNILEPAIFGVPVVIGNRFEKFPEAKELRDLKGLFSISNANECSKTLEKLVTDKKARIESGKIAKKFIENNKGATNIIMNYIKQLKAKSLI